VVTASPFAWHAPVYTLQVRASTYSPERVGPSAKALAPHADRAAAENAIANLFIFSVSITPKRNSWFDYTK
jgi:hypothetical protein